MLPTHAALGVPPHEKPLPGALSWGSRTGFGVEGVRPRHKTQCEIGVLLLG